MSKKSKDASMRSIEGGKDKKSLIKLLPTMDYLQVTVQKEVQQGLLRVARLKPKNPIEFLGKYLIEKSKK